MIQHRDESHTLDIAFFTERMKQHASENIALFGRRNKTFKQRPIGFQDMTLNEDDNNNNNHKKNNNF